MSERGRTLRVVEVSGARRAMGESFGEQLRAEARELYATRLRSIGLTVAGGLPSLGINEAGLAVDTTSLRTRDAQARVAHVSLIDRGLRSRITSDALKAMSARRRAGGHVFYMATALGSAVALACTGQRHAVREVTRGVLVHANDCFEPDHREVDVDAAQPSTQARQGQMTALAARAAGALDEDTLESCRDDVGGTSTNAAAIFAPEGGVLLACHGPPSRSPWVELRA